MPEKDPVAEKNLPFEEIGVTGLNRWGGFIHEEFLRELRGKQGAKIFREMRYNDSTVWSLLLAMEQIGRGASWSIEPGEKGDQQTADFIRECMFDDMSHTWQDTLSEIFTFWPFGWSFLEIVYKRRTGLQGTPGEQSKFTDGRIGWRKWALRAQETLYEWILDDEGGIQGMIQQKIPQAGLASIPIEKALLFRARIEKNNPEGLSVLRSAYIPWYYKRRMLQIQGIGVERDLAGLPMLTPPEGTDLWNTKDAVARETYARAQKLVKSIRRDEQEGIVKPYGWTLELLTTGGRRQFDIGPALEYFDQQIMMSSLADVILLGHEGVGSFALSRDKSAMFAQAISGYLDSICAVVNRHAIPRLLALNGLPTDNPPRLVHGDPDVPDLVDLGEFISKLTGAGAQLFPDDELEAHLRRVAKLPQKKAGQEVAKRESDRLDAMMEMALEIQGAAKRYLEDDDEEDD